MTTNTRLSQVVAEWHGNPRLRYGVYLMVSILWLYVILLIRDAAVGQRNCLHRAQAERGDFRPWNDQVHRLSSSIAKKSYIGRLLKSIFRTITG